MEIGNKDLKNHVLATILEDIAEVYLNKEDLSEVESAFCYDHSELDDEEDYKYGALKDDIYPPVSRETLTCA